MGIHNKVILAGTIGTEERWSVNLSFGTEAGSGGISSQASLQEWADGIDALMVEAGFLTSSKPLWDCLSGSAVLQTATCQYIGVSDTVEAQAVADVSKVGLGGLSKTYPTAVVCSLSTGLPGASKRGRFYWPGLGCTIGNNGRLQSNTHPELMATGFKALLRGIADAAGESSGIVPVVYSPTLGTYTPIVSLRVGDVPDAQSRRRDKMQESYSSISLFP